MFPVILYVLGCILLLVLIILAIKMIKTLNKVDEAIADYNSKAEKLNGVFDLIDTATDTISTISDKLVSGIISGIAGLFKKKNKEDKDE